MADLILQLVKTVDLDPTKNYIFGFHPHGETHACLSVPPSVHPSVCLISQVVFVYLVSWF